MAAIRIRDFQIRYLLGAIAFVLCFIFILLTSEGVAACEADSYVSPQSLLSTSVDTQSASQNTHDMSSTSSYGDYTGCQSTTDCEGCQLSSHCVTSVAIDAQTATQFIQTHGSKATSTPIMPVYVSLQPNSLLRPPIV